MTFCLSPVPLGQTALQPFAKSFVFFSELNIPVAPGKTFAPTTSLEFMSILLDSTRMEARLPFDKLIRAKQALQQCLHRKSATLKELSEENLPAGSLPRAGLFCKE